MSESFVLSSIFIAIIVLVGFVGASFGIGRGFVATAAILLGSEFALWWGTDLGHRLDRLTGISLETNRFLGGILLLLLTILLLGISGSVVLRWGTPTRWGALLGALLGAANGALLIGIVLRLYYMSYTGKLVALPLDDAIVTKILWRNFDWFLLGFVAISSVLLLYTRITGLVTTIPDPANRGYSARPIPPPVARTAPRISNERPATNKSGVGSSPNGYAANRPSESIDETLYAPPHRSAATERSTSGDRPNTTAVREPRTELPSTRNTVRFCPNCGMTLDASDRFCPDCGFTL